MRVVHYARVDHAGHGWNEAFVRHQLDVLGAFLEGQRPPGVIAAA